jgi:MFS family permease
MSQSVELNLPPQAVASPEAAAAASRRLLTVLFIGVFMSALDTSVIGPAIPVLRRAFGVDNRMVSLVMTVFILFSMASTALMANLSDRHGRRPVYLAGVVLFGLGSLVIALSPRFWMIVLGRVIQGIGSGGIVPTASALIADRFTGEQRGKALGLIGATYGMAFVFGPPLAALLMVVLSWHWIFLLNLPIVAAVLWLGLRALPRHTAAPVESPLDVAGIALTFATLCALVLSITRFADGATGLLLWPWLLLAAALLLAALVVVERRAALPMIPLQLFGNRQLVTAYLLTFGAGFGMGGVMFLTSIATLAHGIVPKNAGFVLMPLVLASMAGAMGSGWVLSRVGARAMILLGFASLAVGYAGAAVTGAGLWVFLVASVPVGLGVGIVVGGALRTIAIDEAPVSVRGAAQGLINICTSIGTLLAATSIGALADFSGGGAHGFGLAYRVVAALMGLMLLLALTLRGGTTAPSQR